MSITANTLDEIIAKSDLPKMIGRVVNLTKTGKEWKGLCPFHDEKSPSFYVNGEKGFFHCFGCGAHGNAVDWLVKQGLSRPEAVDSLSKEMGISSKKGGSKLNRSETVTVRLDPKLNYLCELASRAQRRTKSSFIEWAVADAMASVFISDDSENALTIKQVASDLWHVDEADRVASLALIAPSLLTHEEQILWKLIRENGYVWRGHYDATDQWRWNIGEDSLIKDRLRENWETFKAVASGEESIRSLPSWLKDRPADISDDVPF